MLICLLYYIVGLRKASQVKKKEHYGNRNLQSSIFIYTNHNIQPLFTYFAWFYHDDDEMLLLLYIELVTFLFKKSVGTNTILLSTVSILHKKMACNILLSVIFDIFILSTFLLSLPVSSPLHCHSTCQWDNRDWDQQFHLLYFVWKVMEALLVQWKAPS